MNNFAVNNRRLASTRREIQFDRQRTSDGVATPLVKKEMYVCIIHTYMIKYVGKRRYAGDGRSLLRSRERTRSYAPGRSSTSVSDSRENSRTVIAFTSGDVATTSRNRIGCRDRGSRKLFAICVWVHVTLTISQWEKHVFQQFIII